MADKKEYEVELFQVLEDVEKIKLRQIIFFVIVLLPITMLFWFTIYMSAKPGTPVEVFGIKFVKDGERTLSESGFCEGWWNLSTEYTKIHNKTPIKNPHWNGVGGSVMSELSKNGQRYCRVVFWNGIQSPENSDDHLITVVRQGYIPLENSTGNPAINQSVTFDKLVRTGKGEFEKTKTSFLYFIITQFDKEKGLISGKIESDQSVTQGAFTFSKE